MAVMGARFPANQAMVPVLIAANVALYVATAVQSGSGVDNTRSSLFDAFALWPLLVGGGDWWRLLTSGFLHIGLAHLAMNMIALWVLGRDLEFLLGSLRFAGVYFLSLCGGSAAVFLFGDAAVPVAGASGAIYGLMGGIAIAALRLKVSLQPVLIVIGLNVLLSINLPDISLLGHVGGLVVGTAASAALVYAPAPHRRRWQAGSLAVLLAVLIVLVLARDAQFGNLVCSGYRCGQALG